MPPSLMSLFDLLKFLALFVTKIGSHLLVRFGYRLMNAPGRVAPNVSESRRCFIDHRRNCGDLLWCQVELGAEPFLHPRAD